MHVASDLLELFGSVVYFDGKINSDGPQKVIRARTRMSLKGVLILGCYLELEPGKIKWVDFRYEGVFILCTHCGSIGHKDSYCKKSPKKAKEGIIRSMNRLCKQQDCIINEESIMPVYSMNISLLHGNGNSRVKKDNWYGDIVVWSDC
ncbi:Toll-like receptor 5 [Bienertia sinuspersici]